ncbi:hypothetical protein Pan44_20530 [Caulifigura coniformis]|uniref:Knr4/Smi1-like domain-containing protein n=1 Tax=Caulifigura coniformis TaxID=2527983 RepID=A0A517SD34_9PLAN|nr:SMI1/KNR4 family protein [Caulifigura coniformis]QDT54026.1 hypothetical protein Pan44_20530 [Caulifigura coniformis]
MTIDEISVVEGKPLQEVSVADVDEAERVLGVTFPEGYREYITRFGEGALSVFVRVFPPWEIANSLQEWRDRIDAYWFWGERKLSPKRAGECIRFADTLDGDEFCFHPKRPGRLYVLPREEESVSVVDGSLWDLLKWCCVDCKLNPDVGPLEFEPFNASSRTAINYQPPEKKKRSKPPTILPTRTPEQTLEEFWEENWKLVQSVFKEMDDPDLPREFSGFESDAWRDCKKFKKALWERLTTGAKFSDMTIGSDDFAPDNRDEFVRTEIKGAKAYVYTLRAKRWDRERKYKHRWVLEHVDGEWRIKERQKEGMKIDKYVKGRIE